MSTTEIQLLQVQGSYTHIPIQVDIPEISANLKTDSEVCKLQDLVECEAGGKYPSANPQFFIKPDNPLNPNKRLDLEIKQCMKMTTKINKKNKKKKKRTNDVLNENLKIPLKVEVLSCTDHLEKSFSHTDLNEVYAIGVTRHRACSLSTYERRQKLSLFGKDLPENKLRLHTEKQNKELLSLIKKHEEHLSNKEMEVNY